MSPLEPLAPDQRAVVALVLQQGRSYDEIAALLGIPVDAVRARAQAGLAALAPGERAAGRDHRAARGLPARPAAGARRRGDPRPARRVRARPRAGRPASRTASPDVAPAPLPEIPAGERRRTDAGAGGAAEAAARRTRRAPRRRRRARPRAAARARDPRRAPARRRRPPPARLAARRRRCSSPPCIAVVGVVLFLVLRGGDDDEEPATAGTRRRPTATRDADRDRGARPGRRRDPAARRRRRQGQGHDDRLPAGRAAAVRAPGRRTSRRAAETSSYAVWLTGPGAKARRLGFTEPGRRGRAARHPGAEREGPRRASRSSTRRTRTSSSRRRRREDAKRPAKVVLSGQAAHGPLVRAAASPGS